MGCFQVRYDSRVIIYVRKLFIRLATDDIFRSRVTKNSPLFQGIFGLKVATLL